MNKIMLGFVTDNQDPDQKGRIKVNTYHSLVPTESNWLQVLTPFAGEEKGFFCLPDVDDMVVVAFHDHKYKSGYVLGSTWPQSAELPLSEENGDADLNADGNNALRYFRSKSGQRIILDDTEGAEKVQILNPDGTSRIELNAEEEVIKLSSEADVTLNASTLVSITAEEMSVELEGDLTAQCDNLGIEAGGDAQVQGSGSLTMEGQGVGIN